jgi:predicted PurR-regulated permease PerM
VLAVGILYGARPFIPGLLGAAVLYVVSVPVYHRLLRRLGRGWAALVITIGVAILLVLPAIWLTAIALEQAPDAFTAVTKSDGFVQLSTLHIGPLDVGAQLSRIGEVLATWASRQALALVGGITRAILNLLIATVGLYYLLLSADALWKRLRPIIPFSAGGAEELRKRFGLVTQATLLGIAATGLAQGTTIGVAFWLVGLPNPVVWGTATAVASIFPILGSGLVWGPGVIVLIVGHRYGAAIALALVGGLIASNIDNVIRPLVYRRVSGVHPMATLVGAFAGVELMGLIGLLMGPLAISYLFELLDLYDAEYGIAAQLKS